ncbi:N-acetyltransferase family protein [Flavobacterium faecale]|uniref:GNAT family N-acetyltransferase n=1 Tax=Flavobacterium faecale TaxID=1355330 RepID=UPI003AAE8C9E
MIEIIPATVADFSAIQEIARTTWPKTYGAILSKEQMDYMLDLFYSVDKMNMDLKHGHYFAVAKEHDVPIGFVSFEHHYPNSPITKIHKLYLLLNFQGKGIGKLLVDYVAEKAKENHSDSIFLNVNRFNKALDFYMKIGFEILKEENIDIGRGYWMEDYVMEKKL